MIREIYGKKVGMTQIFDEEGNLLPTTLIEVEPVYVLEKIEYPTQVKAKIGCFKIPEKKIGKVKRPVKGYFDKLEISPYKLIREVDIEKGADFSFTPSNVANDESQDQQPQEESKEAKSSQDVEVVKAEVQKSASEPKQEGETKPDNETKGSEKKDSAKVKEPTNPRQIGVEIFEVGEKVDVRAKTKGKGFTGGMKRHGWSGQPGSHGHTTHRRLGSAGASAYPSKIIKGLGMPGHMGNSPRTTKNLKVLKVDKDKDLIFLQGNVPGARGTVVSLRKIK